MTQSKDYLVAANDAAAHFQAIGAAIMAANGAVEKALWQVEPKLAPTEYVGWNDHQPLGSELTEKEASS